MTPEKELETIRKWVSKQDINTVSFETRIPVPRIRAFIEKKAIDPAYTTVRKIQNFKNGNNKSIR
tara:strand:- start:577 stop:771 length:195 start_codon:yes stop_codon:yes gene_type:complete